MAYLHLDDPDPRVAKPPSRPCLTCVGKQLIRRPLHLSRASGRLTNTRLEPWIIDFNALSAQFLRLPEVGEKDSDYFVAGPCREGHSHRSDTNIQRRELIILDGDSSLDPITGEIMPGAPPPLEVHKALVNLDVSHLMYSTHSHKQAGKGNRFRVVVPAVLSNKAALEACVAWLVEQLHLAGCWLADARENLAWSQPWLLPRVATVRAEYFCYAFETGQPFDVEAAVAWHTSVTNITRTVAEVAGSQPLPREPDSPIARFNAEHGVDWILTVLREQGYQRSSCGSYINGEPSYRLLSPYSNSGNAGIVVFKGRDGGWRVHSHHGDQDPLSRPGPDRSTSDAWDLFRLFQHGDDQQAAIAAWRMEEKSGAVASAGASTPTTMEDIEMAEPIPPREFPHQRPAGSGKIKLHATVANIRYLLDFYGIRAAYDVIGKDIELRIPGLSGCPDNADNTTLTHCISLAKLNDIETSQVPAYIAAIADRNQFNPVMEYINRKPWDGTDRINALFETLTLKEGFPVSLAWVLLFRWLISAVAAAAMSAGFRSRGVFVLQGPQSIGKTTFFLSLVDDPALRERLIKIDHHLDAGNKDSIITAVGHWIVEIGELDSSFKKDVARLKGFITDSTDKVRRPYDRKDSEYPRRTVFCASVNSGNFLVDDTGNSRWWTVPVTAINYSHGIDMQQLWAQVHQVYQAGEQWWLTPEEEAALEEQNRDHRSVNVVRDLLESELDFDLADKDWQLMSATQVLHRVGVNSPTNTQARDCGTYLRERLGEPTRSKGRTRWRVPLDGRDIDW